MAESFDPYHQWLGIPSRDQPANYYRLLSINPLEDDVSVIDEAADRQMAHVRTHQQGRYAASAQKLLNEISAARVCLLEADRKSAYDEKLRAYLAQRSGKSLPVAKPIVTPAPATVKSVTPASGVPQIQTETTTTAGRLSTTSKTKTRRPPWMIPAAVGGSALAVVLAVVLIVMSTGGADEEVIASLRHLRLEIAGER